MKQDSYVGLNNDNDGGMTSIGKIVRDAIVFELIPDDETCEGWDLGRLNALLESVDKEWDKYGCLVSQLPPELFERHQKIHGDALTRAKQAGWSGESETDGES